MTKIILASDLNFLPTKIYADYFISDQNVQILCFLLLFLAGGQNFYRFLLLPIFLYGLTFLATFFAGIR